MSKYNQIEDDVPFHLEPGQDLRLACCDCGLVHLVRWKQDHGLSLTFRRDNRATAARRRGMMNRGLGLWHWRVLSRLGQFWKRSPATAVAASTGPADDVQ